ncbi:transcriptional activator NhaR [Alteromonas sp. KUL42]|uniref:LysR family transcriptional regulator n=1 Tax=Alteromonas sp. KUL42 TaxID=2480797 RepID=UPI0007982B65|nr:LysR family transcriptional regulator [Alteromonas sp. KUL42]KXJ58715.1 MAG: LysR family transcriptional regulator [Alteromonas sp. Nap_26]TAP30848.1 LysR family transcriptional regulator [Alteromonas sp. KUL42]GEA09550.1 transcriptional activator NhaR [Alteromonas sp. KUL42]
MHHLNYHHLYYFYLVAREGSIAKAAKLLHVTPQTVSGQLSTFESQLGYSLFDRINKRLYLNAKGKVSYQYASEIFHKGYQLAEILNNSDEITTNEFVIGITNGIPKVLFYDFVHSTMRAFSNVKYIIKEDSFDGLLKELAINAIDFIVADRGIAPGTQVNANSYFLGESSLSFFAKQALSNNQQFPTCLNQMPLLIQGYTSGIRQALTSWLEAEQLHPKIIAEFDDSALLKLFGSENFGVFCAPSAISQHVEAQYNVHCIGNAATLNERYYAITGKSRADNTICNAIVRSAQTILQGGD